MPVELELISHIWCHKKEDTYKCYFDMLESIGKNYGNIKRINLMGNIDTKITIYPDHDRIDIVPLKNKNYLVCERETMEYPNDILSCNTVEIILEREKIK